MAQRLAEEDVAAQWRAAPPLDREEFAIRVEELGDDGVREMVWIFEIETRDRIARLTKGGQDPTTLIRECHTLKGAAATVASPRLALLGHALEQSARQGEPMRPADIAAIADTLDAYLQEVETLGGGG